jgi:putative flippase GtrA
VAGARAAGALGPERGPRLLRYAIAGLVAYAFEYGSFVGAYYRLDAPIVAANVASFAVALAVSFALTKYWVFRVGSGNGGRQLSGYTLLAVVNLGIGTVLLVALRELGIPPLAGKVLVMGAIALWNFRLLTRVVFRSRP